MPDRNTGTDGEMFGDPEEFVEITDNLAETNENIYKAIHEEEAINRQTTARKRREKAQLMREIAQKRATQNVFLNLKAAQRRAKIKEICKIKSDSDNLTKLYEHVQKLRTFIEQAVHEAGIQWENLAFEEKVTFLRRHYGADPKWMSYLSRAVQICFPEINIYKTKCNPIEFNKIILEEVLVPLANLNVSQQMVVWHSNNGDAIEKKAGIRMEELLKRKKRIKQLYYGRAGHKESKSG